MDADAVCDILDAALADIPVTVHGGSYDTFPLAPLLAGRHPTFQFDKMGAPLTDIEAIGREANRQ
ncbi:hypothetical protein ASE49_10905 [Novosphingobium sp. Leaf2]|nr:hypothetical protein ASE49_10905 [Novosphingobium sp. Leaf2]